MTLSTPLPGRAPALTAKQANLPVLSRRSLLAAAPVALAAPTLATSGAGSVSATTLDPLPGLLAQRAHAEKAWLAAEEDSPEADVLWREFGRLEHMIEATVATSPEGVAAQIAYMKESYGPSSCVMPERPTLEGEVPFAFLDVILEGLGRIGR